MKFQYKRRVITISLLSTITIVILFLLLNHTPPNIDQAKPEKEPPQATEEKQESNKIQEKITITNINEHVAIIEADQQLISVPHRFDPELEKSILQHIESINSLAKAHPTIDFFVYMPTMPHDTNLFNVESSGANYLNLFKQQLEVPYDQLEIKNLNDIQDMFFKTDYHWNHKGAFRGYVDIVRFLFQDKENPYPPMSEPCFDVHFQGALSKKIGHAMDINDQQICKYTFQLPDYQLFINGQLTEEYGHLSQYTNGKIETKKGFDHYNYLNQRREAEILFDTNRPELDNILIISDSMSNPIRDTLAAHFNKSIFINLDKYNTDMGGTFDIETYIEKYQPAIVLFMLVLANYFPNGEMKHLN